MRLDTYKPTLYERGSQNRLRCVVFSLFEPKLSVSGIFRLEMLVLGRIPKCKGHDVPPTLIVKPEGVKKRAIVKS